MSTLLYLRPLRRLSPMKITLICALGAVFIALAGCATNVPITLPAPPPVRYEASASHATATTDPVGYVNGQIVTILK